MIGAYPDPKDSWSVVNSRGVWTAVKRSTGILTKEQATALADKKNAADAARHSRFAKKA